MTARDWELFDTLGPLAQAAMRGDGGPADPHKGEVDMDRLLRAFKADWTNREPQRWPPVPFDIKDPDTDAALARFFKEADRTRRAPFAGWL